MQQWLGDGRVEQTSTTDRTRTARANARVAFAALQSCEQAPGGLASAGTLGNDRSSDNAGGTCLPCNRGARKQGLSCGMDRREGWCTGRRRRQAGERTWGARGRSGASCGNRRAVVPS